jgi:Tol biopolymer transport system component
VTRCWTRCAVAASGTLAAVGLGALVACSGGEAPVAPTTGAVEVTLAMTGTRPDPDGVVVRLGDGVERSLGPTGTLRVDGLAPGTYPLAVTGLAFHCAHGAPLLAVTVAAGATQRVALLVTCGPLLRDAVVYATDAYGGHGGFDLVAVRPDGSAHLRLTRGDARHAWPAVSPDGARVAAAVGPPDALSTDGIDVLDGDGGNRRRVASTGGYDHAPTWAPDGRRLAFTSFQPLPGGGQSRRIYVVNADGSGLRLLTAGPLADNSGIFGEMDPAWSPDGARLAFVRGGDLYAVQADGSGLTRLMQCPPGGCAGPAWSPDGRRLALAQWTDVAGDAVADGQLDLWVVQADGSGPRRLTTTPGNEGRPAWSPDGTELVFARAGGGRARLYRRRVDGTADAPIPDVPEGWDASWSPVR